MIENSSNGTKMSENLEKAHFAAGISGKDWFRPDEVASAIGFSTSFVFKLIDQGILPAHRHNAATGAKARWRVHRDALVIYLARTADYEPADFVESLGDLVCRRSRPELLRVKQRVEEALVE